MSTSGIHTYDVHKAYGSVPSWSAYTMDPGPSSRPFSQPNSWTPSAPSISSVPLPGHSVRSPGHSSHYDFSSPPTSTGHRAPSLHPVLAFDPSGRLLLNFMQPFTDARLRPSFHVNTMNELAFQPSITHVDLNFPASPKWSLQVSNPMGVTVYDVLIKIYEMLHRRVGKDEFATFPPQFQSNASSAFNLRCSRDPTERVHGIKRIDFVYPTIFFVGLALAADGYRWDIRLSTTVS